MTLKQLGGNNLITGRLCHDILSADISPSYALLRQTNTATNSGAVISLLKEVPLKKYITLLCYPLDLIKPCSKLLILHGRLISVDGVGDLHFVDDVDVDGRRQRRPVVDVLGLGHDPPQRVHRVAAEHRLERLVVVHLDFHTGMKKKQ